MIRALFVVLGLGLGAALSVVFNTTAGHLNAVAGDGILSNWSADVTPSSTLTRGTYAPSNGAVEVNWQMAPLGWAPPRWRARIAGPVAQGDAVMTPNFGGATLLLGSGETDLGALFAASAAAGLEGTLLLRDANADVSWKVPHLVTANAKGRVIALVWQGQNLGAFDLEVTMNHPVWQANLQSVPDNPITAQARFSGLSGATALKMETTIEDTANLPEGVRRILDRTVVPASEGGWQISTLLKLPSPLP